MHNAVLVRYGEIFLKRGRKTWFIDQLRRRVREALRGVPDVVVAHPYGRILISLPADAGALPPPLEDRLHDIEDALGRVFGVESFSPAVLCGREPAEIERVVEMAARAEIERRPVRTFRVSVNRADKSFPISSMPFNAQLGGVVLDAFPDLRVHLTEPDMDVGVDIRRELTCVYAGTRPGPGGLPIGTNDSALLLLSGGIDSPVAGWLTMKRGVRVNALYFHAFPFTGEQTKRKVTELARLLARWQGRVRLHVVEFAEFQQHCRDRARAKDLVLLYRRQMMRIAEAIALRDGHKAIVTGESIGQVASQTLENLWTIGAATSLPIIRPLATNDKMETVVVARRIGTYELSTQPFDDCCSLFVPRHPELHGSPERMEREEAGLDIEAFKAQALERCETIVVGPE